METGGVKRLIVFGNNADNKPHRFCKGEMKTTASMTRQISQKRPESVLETTDNHPALQLDDNLRFYIA